MNGQPVPAFSLERDAAGNLILTDAAGARHEKTKPVRLFPLTHPSEWISIVDAAGHELVCIEKPDELAEPLRRPLMEALAARDFVPVIQSIKSIVRATNGHRWTVVTDRGPVSFLTESDESIQLLGESRLVIIDHRNTRYLVPSLTALDSRSRHRLERYY